MKSSIKLKHPRKKYKFDVLFLILGVALFCYSVFLLWLILWGFSTSLKATLGTKNLFRFNKVWLPQGAPWEWEWKNYSVVKDYIYVDVTYPDSRVRVGMSGMLLNSVYYALGGALVAVIIPTVVAYATSKTKYKFNAVIDVIVLACMAIPIVGNQPSNIQVLDKLHLFDTMIGFYIQKAHFLTAYYLIMKAAFSSVSYAFSEAAQIEGAGNYTIMLRIVFPMVSKIFLTLTLMEFIVLWNDYTYPLIYLKSYPTLAYGIFYLVFANGENVISNPPMRLAGSFILFTPILVLFLIFKDKLMQNLSMGGVKE